MTEMEQEKCWQWEDENDEYEKKFLSLSLVIPL